MIIHGLRHRRDRQGPAEIGSSSRGLSVITIQSGMLVALGFLGASLLSLLIAPLFWARAVRLTSRRIKESMPVSEIEIRADKDRIRAEYAIKVHKLESEIEQVRHSTARRQIEINRRDANVNVLEAELEQLRANHEESLNARRVLEQTVTDRLPRVEQGLSEAKKLLFARDREIGELTRTGETRAAALAETKAIAAQLQSEIDRQTMALAARNREQVPRNDAEAALRGEIEVLRAKTREQAQLLARLQSLAGRPATAVNPGANGAANGAANGGAADGATPETDKQLRLLRSRNEDQASEIARLKAALAVFEKSVDSDGATPLTESRIGLKARLQSLEAQTVQQSDTILRLRSDLAAANERVARQASHFTNELRRLGGTGSGQAPGRRASEAAARLSLTDRVVQTRVVPDAANLSNVEPLLVAQLQVSPLQVAKATGAMASGATAANLAATNLAATRLAATSLAATDEPVSDLAATSLAPADQPLDEAAVDSRPRLLDRIASLGRN